jgi:carbon storage regulator
MLVLSRKINQSVMIGDDIQVIVLETKGDTAKLGIVAPSDVKVFRQEIYLAIKAENQKSAQPAAVDAASSLLKQALQARKKNPE